MPWLDLHEGVAELFLDAQEITLQDAYETRCRAEIARVAAHRENDKRYRNTPNGKKKRAEQLSRWRALNPDKVRAHLLKYRRKKGARALERAKPGVCSVEGCTEKSRGKGLCRLHYFRVYRSKNRKQINKKRQALREARRNVQRAECTAQ